MEEKGWHLKFGHFFGKREKQIGILAGITALALVFSLWNVMEIKKGLEYSAREYCEEITAQMRDAVNFGIDSKMIELVNVADSVSQAFDNNDTAALEEFLSRKSNILDFDALFLIDDQGTCVAQAVGEGIGLDSGEISEQLEGQDSYKDEVCVGFFEGQTLFYSAPVAMEENDYVLVAIRSKETMQRIISSSAFDGDTLSCIVDCRGEVVLSPADLEPFTALDLIFKTDSQGNTSSELRQMMENMSDGKAGIVRFTDVVGSENLMAYNPLGFSDWVLLTIVPANMMEGNISTYLFRTFFILLGTALMFMLLLMLIYRINNENQKRLTYLAFEDSVTGGRNNAAFQQTYRKLVREGRLDHPSVVLLNVRRFKLINEKMGFGVGNDILKLIYQECENQMDENRNEFAARSEMDNFFICIYESQPEQIRDRVSQLEEVINQKMGVKYPGNDLKFTAGCYLVEDESLDIRVIQDRARIAVQDETSIVRDGCAFYSDSIADRIKREQEMETMFEDTLANRGFQVYLQPKVNLESCQLVGAEALVRWNHPTMGTISPADFIPLFEKNGKICKLDFYVFEEVCRFYKKRQEEGKLWYPVSVNLSRYHFYEENFLDKFYTASQTYGLAPNSIEFELTESMFFDGSHNERIKKGIQQMHQMGFRCSMDDFGAGYSSLGILKEFDVDTIKMDRSFFLDMNSDRARNIIRSVVELAEKLQMETVAEGIEQTEQMEFLHLIRCNTVQGYFFSKPLPMDEFESWVSRYETGQSENTI